MREILTEEISEIVHRFSPYINFCAKKYFLIGATNEDLYEEGLIGLLEAYKSYRGEDVFDEKFSSFAKLCIKRQIIDAIKRANAKKNKPLNESLSIEQSNDDKVNILNWWLDRTMSNDPLDLFLDKEKIDERLKICKEQLSEFEKQVLECYLEGMKQSEIAKMLKRDSKSIDNTIQRIKSKLK